MDKHLLTLFVSVWLLVISAVSLGVYYNKEHQTCEETLELCDCAPLHLKN